MSITPKKRSIHNLGKFVCLFYFVDGFLLGSWTPRGGKSCTFHILHYTKIIMQPVTVIFDIYIAWNETKAGKCCSEIDSGTHGDENIPTLGWQSWRQCPAIWSKGRIMIVIKPKDQSETKTLLVLVSRGPGRPQYENDTGGCGTLFLIGGGEGKRSA